MTARGGDDDDDDAEAVRLDEILDHLRGSASPSVVRRVNRAFRAPNPSMRSWIAAVCTYGAAVWDAHHAVDWRKLTRLLLDLRAEHKLDESQYRALMDLHPELQAAERGLPRDLPDAESAALARDAVRRLRELLPDERERIDRMMSASFSDRADASAGRDRPAPRSR